MTPDEILDAFSASTFPSEAIAACRTDRDAASQTLLNLLNDFLDQAFEVDPDESERAKDAIFMVVHLLAEFREKRAFPLLMRLLGCAGDMVERILGDAISETLPGIIISTFDGDLRSLHQLITNNLASEPVRAYSLHVLAYLTNEGTVSRESTQQFLQECFDRFQKEQQSFVWIGWLDCITMLGLDSFVPLVERAFREDLVNTDFMNFFDFQNDLKSTINAQLVNSYPRFRNKCSFDNVDILSSWAMYNRPRNSASSFSIENSGIRNSSFFPQSITESHPNPHRKIGRNDPCPCGSGKKFKKCCLQ